MMKRLDIGLDRAPGRVIITDPAMLASLRPSPEAIARIERLERSTMGPHPRILLD